MKEDLNARNLPTYSSILKVLTYLKEMRPFLWNSISTLYISNGVEPVGKPSTKYLSGPGWKSLMRFLKLEEYYI